jgi:UDP-glucose 4-epimerase
MIKTGSMGKLKELFVNKDDYPIPDCTGIRDYILVVEWAKGLSIRHG